MTLDRRHHDVGSQQKGHGRAIQIRGGFGRGLLRLGQRRRVIGPERFKEAVDSHLHARFSAKRAEKRALASTTVTDRTPMRE
jgi:hypothetical protein